MYLRVLISRLLGPADPQVELGCHNPGEPQVFLKRKACISGPAAASNPKASFPTPRHKDTVLPHSHIYSAGPHVPGKAPTRRHRRDCCAPLRRRAPE